MVELGFRFGVNWPIKPGSATVLVAQWVLGYVLGDVFPERRVVSGVLMLVRNF